MTVHITNTACRMLPSFLCIRMCVPVALLQPQAAGCRDEQAHAAQCACGLSLTFTPPSDVTSVCLWPAVRAQTAASASALNAVQAVPFLATLNQAIAAANLTSLFDASFNGTLFAPNDQVSRCPGQLPLQGATHTAGGAHIKCCPCCNAKHKHQ